MQSAEVVSRWLLLAACLAVGFITSVEDFRKGKIRNKWLLVGLAAGFAGHATNAIPLSLMSVAAAMEYGRSVLLNAVLALAAGYALWKFGVWSAGDGKLFFVLALLVPLDLYAKGYFDYFPAAVILINTFSVAFVFLMVKTVSALVRLYFRRAGAAGERRFLYDLLTDGVGELPVWAVRVGREFMRMAPWMLVLQAILGTLSNVPIPGVIVLFLLFAIMKKIQQTFPSFGTTWFLPIGAGLAALTLVFGLVTPGQVLGIGGLCLGFMAALQAIKYLLGLYVDTFETREISVSDLRSNMSVAAESLQRFEGIDLGTLYPEGLTVEQAEQIRGSVPLQEKVSIYRTTAFSPFVYTGILLTLYSHQSVLHLVLKALVQPSP